MKHGCPKLASRWSASTCPVETIDRETIDRETIDRETIDPATFDFEKKHRFVIKSLCLNTAATRDAVETYDFTT